MAWKKLRRDSLALGLFSFIDNSWTRTCHCRCNSRLGASLLSAAKSEAVLPRRDPICGWMHQFFTFVRPDLHNCERLSSDHTRSEVDPSFFIRSRLWRCRYPDSFAGIIDCIDGKATVKIWSHVIEPARQKLLNNYKSRASDLSKIINDQVANDGVQRVTSGSRPFRIRVRLSMIENKTGRILRCKLAGAILCKHRSCNALRMFCLMLLFVCICTFQLFGMLP